MTTSVLARRTVAQEQASLVLQDPVAPPAWLDLGDEDGDLTVALLCLLDVVDDRVD
ncbi:MAG TPA: hypothetical protein VMR00_07520 [Streptosporangiaceae bacterium]|nr:hypothetical protein [Streptosporangiaceae bacterium]